MHGCAYGDVCLDRNFNGTNFYAEDRAFPAHSDPRFDLYPINSVRLIKVTGSSGINC